MNKRIEFTKDAFSNEEELVKLVEDACDMMEQIYDEGDYPKVTVKRTWSDHNPIITGELAVPSAYRWYLTRELKKLAEKGAEVKIFPSRPRLQSTDPSIFDNADEDEWDITQKKLFLFRDRKSTRLNSSHSGE